MTLSKTQLTRLAEYHGVCAGCERGIQPGDIITKPPGRAWKHQDCSKPRGRQR